MSEPTAAATDIGQGGQDDLGVPEQPPHERTVGHRDTSRATGSAMRSGLAWTMGGQWAGYLAQLATTAILARLLLPKDFGLLGEALTLTALATQLQTLGLSQAVIQRDKLTHGQLSNLFWVNVGAGTLLAVVIAAMAPVVSAFYGDSRLTAVTMALAITYLISGFGIQHSALMARGLQFRAIALRSLTPRVLGGACAVAAAYLGAGYWALVVQQVVGMLFTVILVWLAIDWRPGRPRRHTGVGPLLRFGAGVSVANLLYYFSANSDNILVGRFLGQGPLGLYSRAYNLFLVPLRQLHGPLANVVQPILAAIVREPERYRRFYCRVVSGIAIVGMPGVVFLAVMSKPVIVVLLGSRWTGAAEPFRWLAVAGFFSLLSRTFTWLYTTVGRPRAMAIGASINTPLTVGAFAIGLLWGITGVAAAYAVVQTMVIVPALWYSTYRTPVRMSDVAAAVWRPAIVAAVIGAAVLAIRESLRTTPAATQLAVCALVALACWAAIVALWPAVRNEVVGMVKLGRRSRAGKLTAS